MKKTKRFLGARAVMTLLLAMLTTMTAWAQECEHEFNIENVVSSPTCTEDGSGYYSCSKCGDPGPEYTIHALGHNIENGLCTVCGGMDGVSYVDEDGKSQTEVAIPLTGSETELAKGWYVVNSNISYTGSITFKGEVHIILADDYTMTVTTTGNSFIPDGMDIPLSIYGQTNGTGTLNVTSSTGKGIYSSDDITINGGIINASGAEGGIVTDNSKAVTINGGKVTTSGHYGIDTGNFNFNGGQVTATGVGEWSKGISAYNTITLSWTNSSDFIKASSYSNATLTKNFVDEAETIYRKGTLDSDQLTAICNQKLTAKLIDIATCDATVPDLALSYETWNWSYICYRFSDLPSSIGEEVKDDKKTLTRNTDYYFGRVTFANGDECTDRTNNIGDKFKVEIIGDGDYTGSKWVEFMITSPDANDEWGDLEWSFHAGTLTINKKDGVIGDVAMTATSREGYTWFSVANYVKTITIGEGITSIASSAFAGTSNVHSYGSLTTLNLPSTVTEIGENAFAYCSSLTIDLDAILAKNITLGNNAFYQIGRLTGSLADNGNNTTKLELFSKATAKVTLLGRTLTKNGKWNTICLPFSMTAEQIAASPLAGATIKEMDCSAEGTELNDGTLTLKFNTVYDPTDAPSGSIVAGTPYIVKWKTTAADIVNPEFSGVTIFSDAPTAVKSYDNKVTFVGQYSPFKIGDVTNGDDGNKNEIIMLGANNELGYSNNARSLKCFRAHFYVKSDGSAQAARAFVLDFDDETTSLSEELRVKSEEFATAAEWYSMDGRKLNSMPTQKGIYIVNGKKIVIK